MSAGVEAVGLCAGALTTLAFVPQVVKAWRTRSTADLSAAWLVSFTAGVGLWFVYGVLIASWPVVVANGLTLLLTLVLVALKLRRERPHAAADAGPRRAETHVLPPPPPVGSRPYNGRMVKSRIREHILEQAFADAIGATQAVAASSGTTALALGLAVAGVGEGRGRGVTAGDEVIVSALASRRVLEAATRLGARPVFADVDPFTLTLVPQRVGDWVTDRTRAVVAEHVAGVPCDVEGLADACRPRGLVLVEDASDALTATLRGLPLGAHGRPTAFAFGSLGLLALPDAHVADLARGLRGTLDIETTEEDAGRALTALKALGAGGDARRGLALRLRRALVGVSGLVLPVLDPGLPAQRAWPRFVVQVPAARRDRVLQALAARGIAAAALPPAIAPLPHASEVAARGIAIDLDPADGATEPDGPATERFVAGVRDALG